MNFMTVCDAPAICRNCRLFLVRNWLKPSARCPRCRRQVTFYSDPSVQEPVSPPGDEADCILSWNTEGKGTFRLPRTRYLCPSCGKLTLEFEEVGDWD